MKMGAMADILAPSSDEESEESHFQLSVAILIL
jgi:hypothetical protein